MFSEGELVRWYRLYDDVAIVRETGLGVVIEKRVHFYGEYEMIVYVVHKNKENQTKYVYYKAATNKCRIPRLFNFLSFI